MSKKLGDKLRGDVRFNPFNENFDFSHVLEYVKNIGKENVNPKEGFIALLSQIFNGYHLEMINLFDSAYNNANLTADIFSQTLITLANRDMYLITERTKSSFEAKKELSYDEMTNSRFESKIPGFGLVSAQAGLEAAIDGLNVLLNLLNKKSSEEDLKKSIDNNSLDECVKILGILNLYVVIKSGFDFTVWEDYYMLYNKEKKEIKIKCPQNNYQIFNRIGEYRLERNVFASKMLIVSNFRKKDIFYEFISAESLKKRKAKRLKSVSVENGELKYKLASGLEKNSILKELLGFAELTSYYSYIKNHALPNYETISIYDIMIIFSEIQYLFESGWEKEKKEINTSNIENFNLFTLKINRRQLIEYLVSKTDYSNKQIVQMLEIFTHSENYYNLWEKPLLKDKEHLFPALLPLLTPNKLRLLDYWLEIGGFDLNKRGKIFEQHLKETITDALNLKKYFNKELKTNKFRIGKEYEEIDLIIELKNLILISEVKCIKYPFSSRDYHNMYKRLKDATNQLKRKVEFMISNQKSFPEIDFNKKVVSVVITNYPLFSGLVENEIPIVDFSLIENYFINGGMNRTQMKSSMNEVEFSDREKKEKYYTNENEFQSNLESFFHRPLPVIEKMSEIVTSETLISIPSVEPKIILDYLNFKAQNII